MRLIICLLFLFVFAPTFGQNYILKDIPVRDDLNTYLITSSPFIDNNGFVWYSVNTEGVFYRYDGRNKKQCSFEDKNKKKVSTYTPFIYNWIQDANNNIWAINLVGAYIINPKTFTVKYISWNVDGGYRDYKKIGLLKDKKGNIWVSIVKSYILRFDKSYNHKKFLLPKLQNQSHDSTVVIVQALEDGSILAKQDSRIFIADEKGLHFFEDLSKLDKTIKGDIHFVSNGKLFSKNTSGTYYYNNRPYKYAYIKRLNMHVFNYPNDNFCIIKSKLLVIKDKTIYINEIDRKNNHLKKIDSISFKKGIINNALYKDANDIVWFSTYNDIYMLKTASGKFTKHLQLKNAQASTRGIVSDNNDNLYVGSYAGLFKINTKTKATKAIFDPLYDYNYYNSLLVEKDSILWITGEDLFIKSMNLKTNKITDYRYKGKKNEFYSSFIKQKSVDSLWIGSDVGLYVFDKKSKRISKYPHHYAPPKPLRVEDLLESKDGNLWLATNLGLYFKERGKPFVEYLGNNNFFKNQSILTLYEDKNNNLWIGTNNLGVIMLDITNDKLSVYNQSKGLSNNSVCGILESKNSMWFSTYYGLSSLSKQTKKFNNFYEENGISDNEFNSRSVYKKNDTTFYFGGLNGITEFNPEKITFRRKKQKIFLSVSEYYSKGKQENIKDYSITNKVISLPYDKNYFSAEFTMNDLFYKEKNDYYYKIEGLTNGWINVGSSGSVKLFGLPAGNHILLVKGRDFEGFETVNTIKINIRVEQIFFKAPWFITLIILLIAMLIIYIFRKNAHRQKKIFEREKEIIELKSSALKSQMNPHFVFNILNNMQSVMILKGELAVNKYFVAFSRLLRSTLDMSKKELVSLKEEIEYINNYVLLNKLQLNEELEFNLVIDESIKHPEALFIPGMLIQPFVENAILHGLIPKNGKKKLTIEYKLQENFLIISIVDNGVGREASKLVKSNKVFMYESWSTSIVNDRVRLLNLKNKDNVNIDIIDNGENNEKGTKVILRFKI